MSTARKLILGSIARSSQTMLNVLIGFLMMPFMINTLGYETYGIWVIVGGLASVYYLLDFGFASAVVRYVAIAIANDDTGQANRIISTSLVIYSILGFALFLVGLSISFFAGNFVSDPALVETVRWTIIILSLSIAIEFPYKAFAGIAQSYLRYDLTAYSLTSVLIIQTCLIVYFVSSGHGLITLAIITLVSAQISNVIFLYIARYLFRKMKVSRKSVDRNLFKELLHYSGWVFLVNVAANFRRQTGIFAIGYFLGAVFVTQYQVARRLIDYAVSMLTSATNMMTPVFTRYHAQSAPDQLREKLLLISKVQLILALFTVGALVVLGKVFLRVWLGGDFDYVTTYTVLVILSVDGLMVYFATSLNAVLFAVSKHKFLGMLDSIESMFILIFTVFLVQYYGIIGAAFGAVSTVILTRGMILPVYVCRQIKLPLFDFYLGLFPVLLFAVAYFGIIIVYLQSYMVDYAIGYGPILLIGVALVPIYFVVTIFFFNKKELSLLLKVLPDEMSRRVGSVLKIG